MLTTQVDIDQLCIDTVRVLSVDAVQKANSGHPGMPMDAAPMGHVLWSKFMRYDPKEPHWPNRDRFVLSAGHGCMLQYSLLYLTGYNVTLDDLKNFRQIHSKTAGHPEYGLIDGVDVSRASNNKLELIIVMAEGEEFPPFSDGTKTIWYPRSSSTKNQ